MEFLVWSPYAGEFSAPSHMDLLYEDPLPSGVSSDV